MIDTVALREKVLDLAIRGKLVPQDPNDEPASVLLERIRAQKQQMVKDGKLKVKDIKDDSIIFVGEDNLHYEKFADGTVKCIEDEIPFELPEGWAWERLSNLATFSGGKTPSTSNREYWEGDILWVTSKDMKCKYIDSSLLMISEKGLEQMQLYPESTLLLVTRSGILRHTIPVAILKKPATINQDLKAIMLYIPNLEEYIYICIKGMESRLILEYTKAGATVENINFDAFQKILLPIPPENQIQRIIDATNDTDEVIGKLKIDQEDLIDIIDKTKSKILDLAIRGKLVPQTPDDAPASVLLERIRAEKEELIKAGKIKSDKKESVIFKGEDNSYYDEIPKNWAMTTLNQLTHALLLNDGDWILSENMNPQGEVKLIQLGSVGMMRYVDKGFKYLAENTFQELNCTQIYSGYMLINRIVSDKMCSCILPSIEGKLITTVDTCWVAPKEEWYNLKYLMYTLSSPTFQSLVMLNSAGTTRKRISKNNLINLPFAVPPLEEQCRIVEAIENAFAQLDTIAESLN